MTKRKYLFLYGIAAALTATITVVAWSDTMAPPNFEGQIVYKFTKEFRAYGDSPVLKVVYTGYFKTSPTAISGADATEMCDSEISHGPVTGYYPNGKKNFVGIERPPAQSTAHVLSTQPLHVAADRRRAAGENGRSKTQALPGVLLRSGDCDSVAVATNCSHEL
jgi:hypothetical protein